MKTILLLEHDVNLRETLVHFLHTAGDFNVIPVGSVKDAENIVRTHHIHIALLNCWYEPVTKLIELTKKIWSTKVVCMSTEINFKKSKLEYTADHLLSMPFSIDEFLNALM